jgi:signal transduction histidine kinase
MTTGRRYPILRNLMFFQFSSLFIGIGLLLLTFHLVSQARRLSAVSASRRQIEPSLRDSQEQWRAWKILGQVEVLDEDIARISASFPLWRIKVVEYREAPKTPAENQIVLPRPLSSESDPEYVVYAELDRSRLAGDYGFSGATLYLLAAFSALFLGVIALSARYIQTRIYRPLMGFVSMFPRVDAEGELEVGSTSASGEIREFLDEVRRLHERAKSLEKQAAVGEIARQVAHDIRSPLAALEVATGDASRLPEDKRILIRAAVGRIRDIANSLQSKQRAQADGAVFAAPELLSSLIDPVVSEKRLQFRSQPGVEVELRLDASSYGVFAAVKPIEFKRLLSNLVNNAVESFPGGAGLVIVGLAAREGRALVSVQDNGKGITPEVLAKLGSRGETHGKAGGSGLGLHHARTSAESWGGGLEIVSEAGKGTTATVILPVACAPIWFVPELTLTPGKAVVILDDDASIHRVWQGRLDALKAGEKGVEIVHVSMPAEIRTWVKADEAKARQALYLFDYELLGHSETGLSLAEELGVGPRVILVTSRYEEPEVLEGCRQLKARLLPKGLAASVPMSVERALPAEIPERVRFDAVLIDDDPLTRMTWTMAADRAGKKFRVFSTAAAFLAASDAIDRETPVYVDAELGDGAKGGAESLRIHGLGFGEIYLATGHEPAKFADLPYLRGVLGKAPPWSEAA